MRCHHVTLLLIKIEALRRSTAVRMTEAANTGGHRASSDHPATDERPVSGTRQRCS